jgi:hypothetical protein
MSVDFAMAIWRGLAEASPHGCRVHLSGGEPFGDWERLIELCRRAHDEGFFGGKGPLASIETNAFWAMDEHVVRERITELDRAGMGKLVISADPYHQQFVPIQRCLMAARVATSILGEPRVQVRWRDCLAEEERHGDAETPSCGEEEERHGGGDVQELTTCDPVSEQVFAEYVKKGRERLNGRAADMLAKYLPLKKIVYFADNQLTKSCYTPLLRSRHVHVDPGGLVMPGTCSGIILGLVRQQTAILDMKNIWRRLYEDFSVTALGAPDGDSQRPIVSMLTLAGPCGLLDEARRLGFRPAVGYASKCHLCWELRRFFVRLGIHSDELGPRWLYDESPRI